MLLSTGGAHNHKMLLLEVSQTIHRALKETGLKLRSAHKKLAHSKVELGVSRIKSPLKHNLLLHNIQYASRALVVHDVMSHA